MKIIKRIVAIFTVVVLITATISGSVMAAPKMENAEDGEQHLYAIYNKTTKAVTFSVTEPQPDENLDVREITDSYTINNFIREGGRGDIKTVDFIGFLPLCA